MRRKRLEPSHFNGYPFGDEAILAENFTKRCDFVGVATIQWRHCRQGRQLHANRFLGAGFPVEEMPLSKS
jgi:hypothetical protein